MGRDTVQLETVVSTISREYLLEFTSEYGISEALHPELPGPEDRIVNFPEGMVGVYTNTTIVEVPKELPKVSMVNSSLKKLKVHLASFNMVVKERTTATAITEGEWGFEHIKSCFRDEIIPFVKALKELFNSFD
nr:hypothetical protein [Tanacetum cinerariifolium]